MKPVVLSASRRWPFAEPRDPGPSGARSLSRRAVGWRAALMALIVAGALTLLFTRPPWPQDQHYYQFADQRPLAGLPNFGDLVSNLPFVFVGLAGLAVLRRRGGELRPVWAAFFAGVAAVGFGSAWFHRAPGDASLVWDRLPMTIAFTSLLVAVFGAAVSPRAARAALIPALGLAAATVWYWRRFDDLRPYFAVQLLSLLGGAGLVALYPLPAGWRRWLGAGLGCYALAFAAEQLDHPIFAASGHLFSGHTLKHLFAAAGCGCVVLLRRADRPDGRSLPATVQGD